MLRVDVDIFSGRPNPAWIITDEDAARELLSTVSEAQNEVVGLKGQGYDGLGYREVVVSSIGDDDGTWPDHLPRSFALGTINARDLTQSGELARRIVEDMTRYAGIHLLEHASTPIDAHLRDVVLEQLERFLHDPPDWFRPPLEPRPNPLRTTVRDQRCEHCAYEVSQFNPNFWNRPAVQPRNNCYNYARNWRTDTFAQPGRAHGAQAGVMACANVTTAALADGLHRRCECLSDDEYPRRLTALVVWPDEDYHWYREQRGGFWGHKPGNTAARNHDGKNNLITDPESCDRGGYTDFCGYFYAGRSVVIN
ncbi:hypothetical protein AB0I68_21795 [Streptomyces sp. NPDC050448]|uniref:hypothetical protein n=1 Tax=Streptomyces sp. NPDC050448 TaxID=3155404 RepID=UPI003431ECDA